MKQTYILCPMPHPSRMLAARAMESAPDGMVVTIQEPTRSLEQNSVQWPILSEISRDFQWIVNGRLVRMTPEAWKDILTSAFRCETAQVAQAWDGDGFCLIGHRTREFGKKEFSEWIEFLRAAHERLKILQPKPGESTS